MIFKFQPNNGFLTLALPNGEKSLHCFWLRKAFTKSTVQNFFTCSKKGTPFLDHNNHTELCQLAAD